MTKSNNGVEKIIYNEKPRYFNENNKNLFNISSKVNYKNPFARGFIKNDWSFPTKGEGTLLFETTLEDINNPKFVDNFKYIDNDIDIKIDQVNLQNIIHFKYKFNTKNQIFETCWANAYSEAIFLANKRILGREIESFETYRENLIKYSCRKYTDGADIADTRNEKIRKYFESKRLHFERIDEQEAKEAFIKGRRFIVFQFDLNKKQWNNFKKFFIKDKKGILTKDLNNKDLKLEDMKEPEEHAVLLIDVNNEYLKFLN